MTKKIYTIILLNIAFILAGVSQNVGINRYGHNSQSGNFFVDQYGDRLNRARLNCYGHLLGYPPTVTTDSCICNGMDHIDMFGTVISDGWGNVTLRGFQYSTQENFTNATNVNAGSGLGSFQGQIRNLGYNQVYYYRGFATNEYGTNYGATRSIRTEMGHLVLGDLTQNSTPTIFSVRIPVVENGGAPVSGQVCAYTDSARTELFSCKVIAPTTSSAVSAYFSNAVPGSDYYIEAVVTNTLDTFTLYTHISCPTDLTVRVYQGNPRESYGCDPPEGKDYHFYAAISGNDPRKEHAEYLWTYNGGAGTQSDSILTVHVNGIFRMNVTASIVVGEDTIAAPNTISLQTSDVPRIQTSCSYCEEEFINTMSCSGNAAAYHWVNENNDTVATSSTVKLPTGDYTLWYTDIYGCSFSKQLHIGPKPRFCTIEGEPHENESAHLENGVWVLDSIRDHQNNWYHIKQFGSQCWMRQSMRCTTTPKGVDLINSTGSWTFAQYYNKVYDPEKSKQYGLLYTKLAAYDTNYNTQRPIDLGPTWRGICPEGWHLPNWEECITLTEYIIHQKDPSIVISPAAVPSNNSVATNTNIKKWLVFTCPIDEERDWSELTMLHSGNSQFAASSYSFLITGDIGNNVTNIFCAYSAGEGVLKQITPINTCVYVRCLRNP